MTILKLANILLRVGDWSKDAERLYWRPKTENTTFECLDDVCRMRGKVSFLTYLNAFSACKWRKYTGLKSAALHIELAGEGTLEVVGVAESAAGERVASTCSFSSSEITSLDVEIPLVGWDLVGFTITSSLGSEVRIFSAWYYACVDDAAINPVRLALCTTTCNNERYILPNIELVKNTMVGEGVTSAGGGADSMGTAFHMFVVDNGRSLDATALSDELVTVIPNSNTGGAGGFACGMMAATETEGAFTHVLLMDDDVRILPESLLRTMSLLALAHGRYKDAFLNGAMMSLEDPARQFEDVARVYSSGKYNRIKPDYRMDCLEDVLANERENVEVPQAYGAWWYSCIPVSAICANGLPLPVFLRCDDVEFGVRNQPTYMTMGGICVWHASFEGRFRPSVDCYQYTRNFHILLALHDCASERTAVIRMMRNVRQNLRDMDYGAAEMLLKGFEDYLKGPEFIMHADGAKLLKAHAAYNEQMVPIEEIDPALLREAGVTSEVLARADLGVHPPTWLKVWRAVPYDKHYLPGPLLSDRPCYLVKYGPGTIEGSSIGRTTIICLDPTRTKASIRYMDKARFRAIRCWEKELLRRWLQKGESVREAYRAAMPRLVSREFWESYLKEMGT